MRKDIKLNSSKEELKNMLGIFSKEIDNIINTDETLETLENNIKKYISDKRIFDKKSSFEGIRYDVSKSVKFLKRDNKHF